MQDNRNPFEASPTPVVEADVIRSAGDVVTRPNAVSASRGAIWLGEGWRLFRSEPLTWIGICAALFAVAVVLSLIPVVNLFVSLLMIPAFGGIMLGAHAQTTGGRLRFSCLFEGFNRNGGGLLMLAVLILLVGLAFMAVCVVAMGMLFGSTFMSFMGGAMLGSAHAPPAAPHGMRFVLFVIVMIVMVLASVAVYGAGLIATALVAIHQLPAWPALKLGLVASVTNIGAWLVFGVCAWLLLIVASIPLGLGLIVVFPVLVAAYYAAYRDLLTTA